MPTNVHDVRIKCHADELRCMIWCAMSHTFDPTGYQQVHGCMHNVFTTKTARPLLPCCWGYSLGLFYLNIKLLFGSRHVLTINVPVVVLWLFQKENRRARARQSFGKQPIFSTNAQEEQQQWEIAAKSDGNLRRRRWGGRTPWDTMGTWHGLATRCRYLY